MPNLHSLIPPPILSSVGFLERMPWRSTYPTPLPPPTRGGGAEVPDAAATSEMWQQHRNEIPPSPAVGEGGRGVRGFSASGRGFAKNPTPESPSNPQSLIMAAPNT